MEMEDETKHDLFIFTVLMNTMMAIKWMPFSEHSGGAYGGTSKITATTNTQIHIDTRKSMSSHYVM